MKRLFFLVTIFLAACSTTKTIFILPQDSSFIATSKKTIALKKISLPSYLDSETILVEVGNKVISLNAKFIAPPSELFTQKTISFFKRSLNDPNVYLYPWEAQEKRGILINIKIDNAIFKDNMVILSGTYYLSNLANDKKIYEKNFTLHKKSAQNAQAIVANLNDLYNNLLREIAFKIAR